MHLEGRELELQFLFLALAEHALVAVDSVALDGAAPGEHWLLDHAHAARLLLVETLLLNFDQLFDFVIRRLLINYRGLLGRILENRQVVALEAGQLALRLGTAVEGV